MFRSSATKRVTQHRFQQAAAVGFGGGKLSFKLVAEGHQFIDLGVYSLLPGERWEREMVSW
jgi:hypothetical protein